MLTIARLRLASHSRYPLQLGLTVLLWQASTGVYLLSLAQRYLPDELGAGAAYPGYAMALYAAGRFLLQTPAGVLADRFGRRQVLMAGIAVSLPAVFLMLTMQHAGVFLACSALYGAGSAAVWPSVMAYVGDTHAPERRARTLNMLNLSQMIGLGLGTMAGVTLIDFISYQASFTACLSFSGVALAFAYHGSRTEAVSRQPSSPEPGGPGLWRRLRSPRILMLAGIALLLSVSTTVQAPVVVVYSSDVLHTNMYMLGLMLLAPAAVAGYLVVKYGHLADRFGRQAPLIVGLAVVAVSYYALSITTHPLLAMHLVVLAGLGYVVSVPAWGAAALDATELGGRGMMLGVLATVQGLGGAMGQAIGGLTNATWGPVAPFKLGAILLVLALALTLIQLRQQRRSERSGDSAERLAA